MPDNRKGQVMKRLLYCLFLLAAIAHPALSRDLSPAEQEGLRTQIERFQTALSAQDFDVVGKTVPPKIFEFIARDAGITVEQLRGALTAQMQMALAAVKITEFTMDMQAISLAQTPDGTPYALIPTRTVMETGGQTIEVPMIDAGLAFFWPDGMMKHTFLGEGVREGPALYDRYQLTETSDGHVVIWTGGDNEWHALFRALDRPELCTDERFATGRGRAENTVALSEILRRELLRSGRGGRAS